MYFSLLLMSHKGHCITISKMLTYMYMYRLMAFIKPQKRKEKKSGKYHVVKKLVSGMFFCVHKSVFMLGIFCAAFGWLHSIILGAVY